MSMPEPAYGEDEWAALSLVNTRVTAAAGVFERLGDEPALGVWLEARQLPAIDSPGRRGALARFRRLRADARGLLEAIEAGTPLRSDVLESVNRAAAEPVRPVLTADRRLTWEPAAAASAEAAVARDLIRLVVSADGGRVRTCAAEDCDRLFIQDHGRRIWCCNACGNRIRARRYAARHAVPR